MKRFILLITILFGLNSYAVNIDDVISVQNQITPMFSDKISTGISSCDSDTGAEVTSKTKIRSICIKLMPQTKEAYLSLKIVFPLGTQINDVLIFVDEPSGDVIGFPGASVSTETD